MYRRWAGFGPRRFPLILLHWSVLLSVFRNLPENQPAKAFFRTAGLVVTRTIAMELQEVFRSWLGNGK